MQENTFGSVSYRRWLRVKRENIIRISITTPGSINQAVKTIENYYTNKLQAKAEEFVNELAAVGIKSINVAIKNINPLMKGGDLKVTLEYANGEYGANITMSGKQCAFIEFGAGVYYNTEKGSSKHPKGEELGFTIGSYNPGSPHAEDPEGWWYYDEKGRHHTYGTPTFAPMYNSEIEMLDKIKVIAEKVFR